MTQFSNLAVRILMYAALRGPQPSAVPDIAKSYFASYDHMKKASAELCRLGYLRTIRGRAGGVQLARRPEDICIGEVIRQTEGEVILVECFDPGANTCPISGGCQLQVILGEALAAFFAVLDRYTLADLLRQPETLSNLLGLEPADV
jgi:Rrf2 family protein